MPLQLALLVALGPRPVPTPDAPVLVGETLLDASRAGLLDAVPPGDRDGTPLAHDDVMVWTAWATWAVGDVAVSSTVSVADAGDGGIALIDNDLDGLVIHPCTATDVWLELAELLPRQFELAGVDDDDSSADHVGEAGAASPPKVDA